MEQLVTMACGHTMHESAFNRKLNHFADVIKKHQPDVRIEGKSKPNSDKYDYSYLVKDFSGISKDMTTDFIKGNLIADVSPLACGYHIVMLRTAKISA